MSVVQLGAQVSLTPRSGLLVWQAAVQALTSQAVPVNCCGVGEGFGVGVGVGFADGVAGPAASTGGAKQIVKPTVRPSNSATRIAGKKRESKCDTNGPHRKIKALPVVPEISLVVKDLYFLHCPLALRSSIVCAHHELQPKPGVAPCILVHWAMQALRLQLTARAAGAKPTIKTAASPTKSTKRDNGKRRDMKTSDNNE